MGYLDLIKQAIGADNGEPRQINQDGKSYTFIPGPNGSLTVPATQEKKPIYEPRPSVAKTVPIQKDAAQTAAVRG